jgi:subtilisin-like proprotein convertase family protein
MIRLACLASLAALLSAARLAAAPSSVPTRSGRPTASRPAGAGPTAAPSTPRTPLAVLYDQNDNATASDVTSQDFETALDAFDDEAADDFVVPPGHVWSIDSVFVDGEYTVGPAAAVNLTFFADDSGVPGSTACSYPLQTPADSAGDFTFTLGTPCVLGPGTYWMDVQTRQDAGTAGQWFWHTRSVQSNSAAVWRNPGDGFGTGCTSFSPMLACIPGALGPDLLFTLSGTDLPKGGTIPPAAPGCTASTATLTNTTPVPIPDLGTATSTIVVSGVGSTLWDLNVQTFIRHTYSSDLVITLTSPAGTAVTISSNNGFSDDNVFNGTVWDDDAPTPATLATYNDLQTSARLGPEEPLSAFQFENPNGTWTLTVQDTASLDSGTLDAWSLEVTTVAETPGNLFVGNSNTTASPIPDNGNVTSTIPFSWNTTHACGVFVTTDITHPASGELIVTLSSPFGTTITLTQNNGGANADVFHGTEWKDSAGASNPPGPVTDTTFTSGVTATPLAPQQALGAFNGENPNGTWTLTVYDTASGNTGTLNSWGLTVESCVCGFSVPTTPIRMDEHAGSGSSNLNGVLEIGESSVFEPSWMNPETFAYEPFGFGSLTGPAGPTYTTVDNFADYGMVGPGGVGNCYDATDNCFEVQITGARPSQHFDADLNEILALSATPTGGSGNPTHDWKLHVGESFADTPTSNLFYPFIENIFHNGVTGGCNATDYCPGNSTLRQQMAVFVLKSKEGPAYVPPSCTGIFPDVPCPSLFADWIEELANRGVVAGCGGGDYCPTNAVLRQQMSVFLLKTLMGSAYTPPACTGIFADVPCPSLFADWIEDLYNRAIAAGCGGGNFCPTNPTTRGQMAPFLANTFGLLIYGP